jgi:hypothetical protein
VANAIDCQRWLLSRTPKVASLSLAFRRLLPCASFGP